MQSFHTFVYHLTTCNKPKQTFLFQIELFPKNIWRYKKHFLSLRHPKIKVCMKQKKNFLKDIRALLRCGTRKRTNAFQIFKHRTPKVCPFVSFLKYKIIMLAKIECEGKTYPAILLNPAFDMDRVEEIKASLHSFLESAYTGDTDLFLQSDMCNLFSLLTEMDLTEDQRVKMTKSYFNGEECNCHQAKGAQIIF